MARAPSPRAPMELWSKSTTNPKSALRRSPVIYRAQFATMMDEIERIAPVVDSRANCPRIHIEAAAAESVNHIAFRGMQAQMQLWVGCNGNDGDHGIRFLP